MSNKTGWLLRGICGFCLVPIITFAQDADWIARMKVVQEAGKRLCNGGDEKDLDDYHRTLLDALNSATSAPQKILIYEYLVRWSLFTESFDDAWKYAVKASDEAKIAAPPGSQENVASWFDGITTILLESRKISAFKPPNEMDQERYTLYRIEASLRRDLANSYLKLARSRGAVDANCFYDRAGRQLADELEFTQLVVKEVDTNHDPKQIPPSRAQADVAKVEMTLAGVEAERGKLDGANNLAMDADQIYQRAKEMARLETGYTVSMEPNILGEQIKARRSLATIYQVKAAAAGELEDKVATYRLSAQSVQRAIDLTQEEPKNSHEDTAVLLDEFQKLVEEIAWELNKHPEVVVPFQQAFHNAYTRFNPEPRPK